MLTQGPYTYMGKTIEIEMTVVDESVIDGGQVMAVLPSRTKNALGIYEDK